MATTAAARMLSLAALLCAFSASLAHAQTFTPATSIPVTYFSTSVDGNANSYGGAFFGKLEWDTPSNDALLCRLNSAATPHLDPVCPAGGAGGKLNNKYFVSPMVQAGWQLFDSPSKPILSLLYAKKECDAGCTQCRLCVLAVANRGPNDEYLPVDPAAGGNWVKLFGAAGNAIEMGRTDGTAFSQLRDAAGNLIGFEGCTAPGLRLGNANAPLAVPVGASSITMDAHLQITYPSDSQTSRVASPDGRTFSLPACAAPVCVAPEVAAAGAPVEIPGPCFASTADYTVTLNAKRANNAAVTAPAACTLQSDSRDATSGDGQLVYRCNGLPRGETTQLSFTFTAKSEPACTRTTVGTVSVEIPALQKLALSGAPAATQTCPAAKGQLKFTLTAAQAPTADQLSSGTFTVTSTATGAAATTCTATVASGGVEVTCSDLAAGTYALDASVPNTQRTDCPHTLSIAGSAVTEYVAPTVTVTAPAAKTVCAGAKADFEFAVSAPDASGLTADNGCTVTGTAADGYSVKCSDIAATTTVNIAAQFGQGCVTAATPVELAVITEALTATATAKSAEICPTTASASVEFEVTTSIAATAVQGTLLASEGLAPVAGAVCTTTGSDKTWTVTCSGAARGSYVLGVTATSALGCSYTPDLASTVASVTTSAAPTVTVTAPAAKTVCAGAKADFEFAVTAPGASGLTADNGCTVTGTAADGYSVKCSDIAATTTVNIAAQFGQGCVTAATPVELAVNTEALTAQVTAAATPTQICPAATSGSVAFQVTTSIAASAVQGTLLASEGLALVEGAVCTTTGSDKTWTVTCLGAAPGSYVLGVAATSALGCSYTPSAFASAVATVAPYAYTVNAGADASLSACTGATTDYRVTVTLSADLVGANVTVAPSLLAPAACSQLTDQVGIVFECAGLPAGATTAITVTASKNGCSVSDTVDVAVAATACPGPDVPGPDVPVDTKACFTRTIGYWSTHGEEMKPWLGFKLWGQTFTDKGLTTGTPLPCSTDAPDALRTLCVTGQRVCPDAQLARQCVAARVNLAITTSCGSAANCFKTGGLSEARLDECCGAETRPAAGSISRCIDDISKWNEDKTDVHATCDNLLPAGGRGETQKVCNDYGQAFARLTDTCSRGFCAATGFGRRLLHA